MSSGIVLIGSGPSLNKIDPRKLAPYDAIAFNRSWLAWDDWGFAPRYHACLDPASIAIIGPELPPVIAETRRDAVLPASAMRQGRASRMAAT